MVAITVILAAVIAAFVFGLAGTTQTTRTVGMTVALNQPDSDDFNIQFTGGADLSSITALNINYDGAATALSSAEVAGDAAAVTVVEGPVTGVNNKIQLAAGKNFAVGNVLNVLFPDGTPVSGHKITVVGVFTDGGTQILYDRTL